MCLAVVEQVRESIAENVCSLSPVIGREPTISELLPLVKLFLADEQDGTASIEIRRKVLRSVAPLVETLGAEACDVHLMPEVCHTVIPCGAVTQSVSARRFASPCELWA